MRQPDDISDEERAYWEGRAESESEIKRLRAELERAEAERDALRTLEDCLLEMTYTHDCETPNDFFQFVYRQGVEKKQAEARARELEEAIRHHRDTVMRGDIATKDKRLYRYLDNSEKED